MAAGAVIARIVSQYSAKGSKAAQRDIAKLGKDFDKFSKKATKAFAVAGAASLAFAGKIGKDAVKAVMEDQKSQVLLANSLRNTVGATDSAISSVEDYITKQQKLFSVADDQLRPSLAALAAATGSITDAQKLQSVALDIAANKQIDLVTASKLLAKAHGGNIGALKKLFPEISANTVKSKDFATALDVVAKASSGAAAAAANTLTGRLEGLKLAYGEVLETLGYALLPVLTEFATYIQTSVLPALEAWTNANKDKIAASLKNVFEVLKTVVIKLGEFFGFISRNIGTLQLFGSILAGIFVGTKIFAGITALVGAIGLVTTALTAQTAAASTAAIATGFATAGVSLTLGAAAAIYFYSAMDKVTESVKSANVQIADQTVLLDEQSKAAAGRAAAAATAAAVAAGAEQKKAKAAAAAAAAAAKKGAAAAALDAKKKAASLKAIAALTKAGATARTEDDPIQLEAARLNLVKQGAIAEQARLAAMIAARQKEIDMNNAASEAAQRYNDILTALADTKITPAEFELLAAKWGITTSAAQLYVQTIISVRDNQVSASEVAKLAETWGITYQEAAKYLDFFAALNDGTLSDAEIGKLQEKWSLTEKQVLQYAAVFQAADDGKIDLTEVKNLGDQWGLTKKETEAYIAKILEEFGYDPSLLAAPVEAEGAWLLAYGSVEDYKAIAEGIFTVPSTINDASDAAAVGWFSAAAAAASYAAAVGAANSVVIRPPVIPPVIPPELVPVIPPTGGNDDEPRYVPPRGSILALAAGGIVTSPTLSLIGEAGPEAVIPLSQMGSMGGGSNITINVGGSVISEGDLVAIIRNQLLALQQSGSTITRTNLSI
jgi:hypothetical protein